MELVLTRSVEAWLWRPSRLSRLRSYYSDVNGFSALSLAGFLAIVEIAGPTIEVIRRKIAAGIPSANTVTNPPSIIQSIALIA